jgi:hypothetical protein
MRDLDELSSLGEIGFSTEGQTGRLLLTVETGRERNGGFEAIDGEKRTFVDRTEGRHRMP